MGAKSNSNFVHWEPELVAEIDAALIFTLENACAFSRCLNAGSQARSAQNCGNSATQTGAASGNVQSAASMKRPATLDLTAEAAEPSPTRALYDLK